jgi:hypothetical protein
MRCSDRHNVASKRHKYDPEFGLDAGASPFGEKGEHYESCIRICADRGSRVGLLFGLYARKCPERTPYWIEFEHALPFAATELGNQHGPSIGPARTRCSQITTPARDSTSLDYPVVR